MRGVRTAAAVIVLLGAWALTWGRIARRQRPLLVGRPRLSETLGLMDDHLAEWK